MGFLIVFPSPFIPSSSVGYSAISRRVSESPIPWKIIQTFLGVIMANILRTLEEYNNYLGHADRRVGTTLVENSSINEPYEAIDMGNGKFALIRESQLEGKDTITISDILEPRAGFWTCTLPDLIGPKGLHEWRCQNPRCRKIFMTENRRQIYCSRECQIQAFIERRKWKEFKRRVASWIKWCSFCGKRFITKRKDARFCCPAHQKAAWREARRKSANQES